MASFSYRLNPRYSIKECLSCGALYTRDCSCSKRNIEDKILVPKLPEKCARCGHPVNGLYCQGCALLREKFEEDLVTYLKYFQDTSKSSDDRLYHHHLSFHLHLPYKLLTARKRVGPFPARRLAWRQVSHRSSNRHSSPNFTSDSSYSSSSLDSSSDISSGSSLDSLSNSSSVHSSESSPDSSSKRSLDPSLPFVRPSCKRSRYPTTLVPSSTPILRSIALALDDLPPHKSFRVPYSSEVIGEEHKEMGTTDAETIAYLGIGEGVRAHTDDGIDLGVKVVTSDIREDEEEFEAEASARGTMEIAVDPLAIADMVRILGRENLRVQALFCIERDHVDNLRRHMALSQEEFYQVRRDRDDTRRRLRRLESLVERRLGFRQVLAAYEETHAANALEAKNQSQNGTDGDNRNDGNGNLNENRGARPVAQECSYQDFMKCQPLNFKGREGVVGLIRWFEKMETISISAIV
uniref:Reverse transcriptase domain-containing protein n=1 Tax=Tanacetum cinerariifolium TaxID=118510 RepID=A0A699K9U9_TANCI|nr:reverse transcriptase domain-containing protein [Tanacetum cinerariifolium]